MEIVLFVAGFLIGPFLNYAIYAYAYFSSPKSPWQVRPKEFPLPSKKAYIPVVGWWFRAAEYEKLGRWFWVRPFLLELATPVCLVWLYRYVMLGSLMPPSTVLAGFHTELMVQFSMLVIVFGVMTIATFIDFDERMIPDLITVPATCIGLLGSATLSGWHLWEARSANFPDFVGTVEALNAYSPSVWPLSLNQQVPGMQGLWIGLSIWAMWCVSLGNLRWITRRGWDRAIVYFGVGFARSHNLFTIIVLLVVGSIMITVGYNVLPPTRWQSLLSSLIGIGLGGLLVWGFRIVSGAVLRREALGFGDVTLMAMVGAFFGWQVVWMAFFLAPLFAIVFVLIAWVITRDPATPFGPYLCFATAYVVVDWVRVWESFEFLFSLFTPDSIFLLLFMLLLVLSALLWVVHTLKLTLLELFEKGRGVKKRR